MNSTDCMQRSDTRVISILERISQPSVPFHETRVRNELRSILEPLTNRNTVTLSTDRYGNLIAHYWNAGRNLTHSITLASHMDHPGFVVTGITGQEATAEILGGLPRGDALRNCPVLLIGKDWEGKGVVLGELPADSGTVRIRLDDSPRQPPDGLFAVPDLTRFSIAAPFVHGRAMDDLVGCAIQTAVFEQAVEANLPIDLTVIYHRAEEIGFIGAQGACELGSIPRHSIVISLEASKTLDGAAMGGGIVVRTGDKAFLFDPNSQALLDDAAAKLAERGIRTQRRRMDGGTCEASLFWAHGYDVTAIAVPLLNYHNHGDGTVAPEAVTIYDLNAGVELLTCALDLLPQRRRASREALRSDVRNHFNRVRDRLLSAEA